MTAKPNFKKIEADASKVDAAIAAKDVAAAVTAVRLVRGDAVKVERVFYLWDGYLPRSMLSILGGPPGAGKTTIALSCMAIVTQGGRWPDGTHFAEPADVVIWSGEDAPSVLVARLIAEGADLTRAHFVESLADGSPFDPARDMDELEATVMALPNVALMVVDPIMNAVGGDAHKSNDVRRALQPVVALAQRVGCAVLGITHLSKGTAGRDPLERITGSVAFGALARLVMIAAKAKPGDDGQPRRVLMRVKANNGPDTGGFVYDLARKVIAPEIEGQYVVWGEAIEGEARDVLAEAEEVVDAPSDASAAVDALKRILGRDTVPTSDATKAMTAAGFTSKQTRNARERAGVIATRKGFGAELRGYWKLPHGASLPVDDPDETSSSGTAAPLAPIDFEGMNGQEWASMGTNGPTLATGQRNEELPLSCTSDEALLPIDAHSSPLKPSKRVGSNEARKQNTGAADDPLRQPGDWSREGIARFGTTKADVVAERQMNDDREGL